MDNNEFEAAIKAAGGKPGFLNKGFYNQIMTSLTAGERITAAGECIDGKGSGALIVTDRAFYAAKGTGMLSSSRTVIALDKISSVSRSSGFSNELIIAEGTINHTFPQVSNLDRIMAAIQSGKATPTVSPAQDPAAELRKYKALLDDGIITQEDFDKKKAALLGL